MAKRLTRSDASGRVILPRARVEASLPFMLSHRAYTLATASAAAATPISIKSWANGSDARRVYALDGVAPLLKAARAGAGSPIGLATDADGRVGVVIGTEDARLAAALAEGERGRPAVKKVRHAAAPAAAAPPPPSAEEASAAACLVRLQDNVNDTSPSLTTALAHAVAVAAARGGPPLSPPPRGRAARRGLRRGRAAPPAVTLPWTTPGPRLVEGRVSSPLAPLPPAPASPPRAAAATPPTEGKAAGRVVVCITATAVV